MQRHHLRFPASILMITSAWIAMLAFAATTHVYAQTGTPASGTIAPIPPTLANPSLECSVGYVDGEGNDRVPSGWGAVQIDGDPRLHSTREQVWDDDCNPSNARHVERLEFEDSLMVASKNIESPPTPGKPFDVTIFQQTDVVSGTDYSVSSWMVSLCGGSNGSEDHPNDCPDGYYMAKMLGIDPAGGTDPRSDDVVWVENRDNFVESDGYTRIGWANLRNGITVQSDVMTVFARINSPFQWHGNHAFVDAISLVRAPVASFVDLPTEVSGSQLSIRWTGRQSPDVKAIPASTHQLLIDAQVRPENGEWRDLFTDGQLPDGETEGQTEFNARCFNSTYEFRIRARAEQPPADEGGEGASPNHRFPGVWSDPAPVSFRTALPPSTTPPIDNPVYQFLPLIRVNIDC